MPFISTTLSFCFEGLRANAQFTKSFVGKPHVDHLVDEAREGEDVGLTRRCRITLNAKELAIECGDKLAAQRGLIQAKKECWVIEG